MSKTQTLKEAKKTMLNIWQRSLRSWRQNGEKLTPKEAVDFMREFQDLWFLEIKDLTLSEDEEVKNMALNLQDEIDLYIGDCEQYLPNISEADLKPIDSKIVENWNLTKNSLQIVPFDNFIKICENNKNMLLNYSYTIDSAIHSDDKNVSNYGYFLQNKTNSFFQFLNKFI